MLFAVLDDYFIYLTYSPPNTVTRDLKLMQWRVQSDIITFSPVAFL